MVSLSVVSASIIIRDASTNRTLPDRFATVETPESHATTRSMPVPTNGFSAFSSGTAWRCMFDPISALLASLCSRNGIKDAATETICLGETST